MVTDVILMRHGQIEANVKKLWHGTTDSELSDIGVRQVAAIEQADLSNYPLISTIYSSPLKRTLKTAESLGRRYGISPVLDHDLIEFGVGSYEGLSYESLQEDHGFFTNMGESIDFAAPGGESVRQVQTRVLRAFEQRAAQHQGDCFALVGHGAAFGILMASLLTGTPWPFHEYHLSNTGIAHLRIDSEVTLKTFDDITHLRGLQL